MTKIRDDRFKENVRRDKRFDKQKLKTSAKKKAAKKT